MVQDVRVVGVADLARAGVVAGQNQRAVRVLTVIGVVPRALSCASVTVVPSTLIEAKTRRRANGEVFSRGAAVSGRLMSVVASSGVCQGDERRALSVCPLMVTSQRRRGARAVRRR